MKLLNAKSAALVASILVILAFQNCSQVQFGSSGSIANKAAGVPETQDSENAEDDGVDDSKNAENAEDGGVDDNGAPHDPAKQAEAFSKCDSFRNGKLDANDFEFDGLNVLVQNFRGPFVVKSADKVSIVDTRGPALVRTQSGESLQNMRGPLCVSGRKVEGVVGNLNTIVDHRGPLEVSNLNVGVIQNTRGPLVIRGGKVALIIDHRGPIHLIGAEVVNIQNLRGPIVKSEGATITGQVIDVR